MEKIKCLCGREKEIEFEGRDGERERGSEEGERGGGRIASSTWYQLAPPNSAIHKLARLLLTQGGLEKDQLANNWLHTKKPSQTYSLD